MPFSDLLYSEKKNDRDNFTLFRRPRFYPSSNEKLKFNLVCDKMISIFVFFSPETENFHFRFNIDIENSFWLRNADSVTSMPVSHFISQRKEIVHVFFMLKSHRFCARIPKIDDSITWHSKLVM